MKIVNCTPHPISLDTQEGRSTFPTSGIIPRVETIETQAKAIDGFPCVSQKTGQVQGLPEMVEGTFLIVSLMVFNASDRADLLAPDTGKSCVRNEAGHIQAVTQFIRR